MEEGDKPNRLDKHKIKIDTSQPVETQLNYWKSKIKFSVWELSRFRQGRG